MPEAAITVNIIANHRLRADDLLHGRRKAAGCMFRLSRFQCQFDMGVDFRGKTEYCAMWLGAGGLDMFGHKIRISGPLYEKIKAVAEAQGYSSPEEFAVHVLEKAAMDAEESLSEEEVRKRLKGLGYLEG